MTDESYITELKAILAQKNEEEARTYIQEHFSEFPEDLQESIVVAMAEEALQAESEELRGEIEFNKKVMQALTAWQLQKGDSTTS